MTAKDVSVICFIPKSEVIFNITYLVHLIVDGWPIIIASCHCLFLFGPEELEFFCIPVTTHLHFLSFHINQCFLMHIPCKNITQPLYSLVSLGLSFTYGIIYFKVFTSFNFPAIYMSMFEGPH